MVAGALFRAFLERHAVFELENGTFGEVFHSESFPFRCVFVIAFHYFGQVVVGGGAGFDVLEVSPQGDDDVIGEDFGFQVGEEQLGKRLLPFVAMRLNMTLWSIHENLVVGELMHEGDQHLVGVEVAVERDAAHPIDASWWTEIT